MSFRALSTGPLSRPLCVLLSVSMILAPVAAVRAQDPVPADTPFELPRTVEVVPEVIFGEPLRMSDTTLLAAPDAGKIDTTYVTPEAVALVILRPAQLLTSPVAEMLPVEVATAAGLEYLGFDPVDIVEIVAFAEAPWAGPPQYGVTVKFAKPFRGTSIPEQLRSHTEPTELDGRRYLQSNNPQLPSLFAADERTLLVAPDATLRRLVAGSEKPKTGPLLDRVRDVPAGHDLFVTVDVASLRPLIALGLAAARQQELPPEILPLLEAPNLITAADLTVALSRPGPTALVIHGDDEHSAQRLEAMLADVMNGYQDHMAAELAQQAVSDDPVERAMAQYVQRMSNRWTDAIRPERDGASLTFFRLDGSDPAQQQLTSVAVIGILVALLLPAVQAAREAARRSQSMNNMKNLILGLLNHHDTNGRFPADAIYSDDGKALLSWRVKILPFLEEGELYEQFRLNEPWDSEHNLALLSRMPDVFQNPNLPNEEGLTNYLAVVGEPCVMDGTAEGNSLRQITDGTSKTIMLVEADADRAIPWTKPADFQYDADNPADGLGGLRPGIWLAVFADGHVQPIANSVDAALVKAMFTRAGQEDMQAP